MNSIGLTALGKAERRDDEAIRANIYPDGVNVIASSGALVTLSIEDVDRIARFVEAQRRATAVN